MSEKAVPEVLSGPTSEMIEGWKRQYGRVFKQVLLGEEFYYRQLFRPEYRDKLFGPPGLKVPDRDELVCKIATLWPVDYDFTGPDAPAGIATSLSESILAKSGFVVDQEPVEL